PVSFPKILAGKLVDAPTARPRLTCPINRHKMAGMQKTYSGGSTVWEKGSLCLLSWVLGFVASLPAERLPIKTYTTADGLARDYITRIVRDSRGFLWIGTSEGLSRFDGYQFTTYTRADGLPHHSVRDVLETRSGQYWIATGDGPCRLNPMAGGASP